MARLGMQLSVLEEAYGADKRMRRNFRRLERYNGNAFALSDEEFTRNYRLNKSLFQELQTQITPLLPVTTRRSDISATYKILVTLSFYATGSYQRLVGNAHGTLLAQQTVSRAITEVTNALNSEIMQKKWIKFPQTRQERENLKMRFYDMFGIPGVIGCIDGTHIAIIRPTENEERFFNRKHFHSRNVLILSDADLNILSVDASFGGATHDSYIWSLHPVKQHLKNLINSGETVYLLGDSGFPQREFMMTPIVDAADGTPEKFYTMKHCSARNSVERTIGVLKNRWRCLLGHRVLHYHPEKAAKIINACCVLHNMCNKSRLPFNNEPEIMPEPSVSLQDMGNVDSRVQGGSLELRRGNLARANLVNILWNNHRR